MNGCYARLTLIGCALATACGASTPVAPTPPSPSGGAFAGTWVPTIGIDSCTGTLACIAFDSTWFVLRLAQDSSRITGSAYLAGKSFDVNGLVDANQDLVGSTPPTPTFSLDGLRVPAGPAGLTGTARYT